MEPPLRLARWLLLLAAAGPEGCCAAAGEWVSPRGLPTGHNGGTLERLATPAAGKQPHIFMILLDGRLCPAVGGTTSCVPHCPALTLHHDGRTLERAAALTPHVTPCAPAAARAQITAGLRHPGTGTTRSGACVWMRPKRCRRPRWPAWSRRESSSIEPTRTSAARRPAPLSSPVDTVRQSQPRGWRMEASAQRHSDTGMLSAR